MLNEGVGGWPYAESGPTPIRPESNPVPLADVQNTHVAEVRRYGGRLSRLPQNGPIIPNTDGSAVGSISGTGAGWMRGRLSLHKASDRPLSFRRPRVEQRLFPPKAVYCGGSDGAGTGQQERG